ncbi:CPBP family intramembrane glutamic endopeptidase [Dyella sp.]|uniref:CPBP family intramembrane glutamic endopeptidase n=1 Tax=Dyella sp. TaxID=1869338 RepID=UPI002ED2C90C
MNKQGRVVLAIRAIAVIAVLAAALEVRDIVEWLGGHVPDPPFGYGRSFMDNLMAVVLALLAAWCLRPRTAGRLHAHLGLAAPGWRAPLCVLLATLPNWIGLAYLGQWPNDLDLEGLFFKALLYPLAEELVYRGFGFVFARTALGWRLGYAVLVQAFFFGAIHWLGLRGEEVAGQVFAITCLGGIVFAVLDAMNRYTIWCGLALHASLNAAWSFYDVAPTAATGWEGNALRLGSAALALLLVWWVEGRWHRRTDDGVRHTRRREIL